VVKALQQFGQSKPRHDVVLPGALFSGHTVDDPCHRGEQWFVYSIECFGIVV
jgi:hypothetical protein